MVNLTTFEAAFAQKEITVGGVAVGATVGPTGAAVGGTVVGAGGRAVGLATGALVGAAGAVVGAGVAAGWHAANKMPNTTNKLRIEKRVFIFLLLLEKNILE